jgi:Fe2+ transport system protein FeoA
MNKKIVSEARLIDLKNGDVFKITAFDETCHNFKHRLADLGLFKGALGQVVNKSLFGPIELDIQGNKIAIGRGMAKKIYVKKFECPIL